jgi:hypothetical protein
MPVVRIVATDLVAQKLHAQALKENRTLSAMGLLLLREGLEQRAAAAKQVTDVSSLVAAIRGESVAP